MPTIIINAKIDKKVVLQFRDTIYRKTGMFKGDFKIALTEAMELYIAKHRKE